MSTRTVRRAAAALAVLVVVGASGIVCVRVGERGRFALSYSTYGAGPEGTRGLYLLAERQGLRPRRWAEDFLGLPAGAMLVALGGCDHLASRPLARAESAHLLRWIEQGGTLLVAGADEVLPTELGVRLQARSFEECLGRSGLLGMIVRAAARAADDRDAGVSPDAQRPDGTRADGGEPALEDVPRRFAADPQGTAEELAPEPEVAAPRWAVPVGAPLAGMAPVAMRLPANLVVETGIQATTLLVLDGSPAGVEVRRGRGRVIVLASASPMQNRDLVGGGGAVLFTRLLREHGGPVIFDEYHLGIGERRSMMRYFAQAGLAPLALQVLVIAGLLMWRRGARFGAPRGEPTEEPATTASFVAAIGTLFSKSRDATGALAIVARHAIARIAARYHLEVREPEALANALRARRREAAADAVIAIARVAEPPERRRIDLVRAIRAIDTALKKALAQD